MCRLVSVVFGVLYTVALGLFAVGTFGLFGQPTDPLAGVFLIPLGVPWIYMIDGFPEAIRPWAVALAPLLNWFLFGLFCAVVRSSTRRE